MAPRCLAVLKRSFECMHSLEPALVRVLVGARGGSGAVACLARDVGVGVVA